MNSGDDQAVYLYCLTRSPMRASVQGTGVDGRNELFLHNFRDIAAVLSRVSLEEFCGPSAQARLQDLTWLAPRAYRHGEVVEEVMRHCPVLPARFGTLFSSLWNLEEILRANHRKILEFLDQVVEKREWSVKVFLDRAKAREELLAAAFSRESERLASLSAGRRYFQEQRLRSAVDSELRSWLEEVCGKTAAALRAQAADFRERRLLPGEITGRSMDMILNWAFLVPESAQVTFSDTVLPIREGRWNDFSPG